MVKLMRIPIIIGLTAAIFSLKLAADSEFSAEYELDTESYGVYEEFGSSLYAVKLETQNAYGDASNLFEADEHKALSMRVLADNIGTRQWCRFWTQNIAINTNAATLEQLTDPLLAMCDSVQSALMKGDQIDFLRETATTTQFRINGGEVAYLEGDGLFEAFLYPFLGRSPINERLKNDLLSNNTSGSSIYLAAVVSPDRAQPANEQNVQILTPPVSPSLSNAAVATPDPEPVAVVEPEPEPVAAAGPEPDPVVEAEVEPVIDEPVDNSVQLAEAATVFEADAIAETNQQEVVESTSVADAVLPDVTEEPAIEEINETITEDFLVSATPPSIPSPVEVAPVTRISPLEIQEYQSNALRHVYGSIEYPQRAVRGNMEGRLRFNVRIGRNGSLLGVQALELSEHDLLNEAAEEAIVDSEPFFAPPLEAGEEYFDLILPIVFMLQ